MKISGTRRPRLININYQLNCTQYVTYILKSICKMGVLVIR